MCLCSTLCISATRYQFTCWYAGPWLAFFGITTFWIYTTFRSSNNWKNKVWKSHSLMQQASQSLPCSHLPPYPANVPSGQIQATLRIDVWVFVTIHCWEEEQGLLVMQGFLQASLMQVSDGGQSASTLHSGSSAITARKIMQIRSRFSHHSYFQMKTYVQHMQHIHRQWEGSDKYMFLYDYWQCNQLLEHNFQDYREVDILSCCICLLGSHTSH